MPAPSNDFMEKVTARPTPPRTLPAGSVRAGDFTEARRPLPPTHGLNR